MSEYIMKRLCSIVPLVIVFLLVSAPAMAYVDPGSGSLIIQMLIAASVGAVFYFRQVRDKIKSILFGDKKAEAKPDASDDGNTQSTSE